MLSFHQGRLDAKLICGANLDNGYKFLNHLKHNNTEAFTMVPTELCLCQVKLVWVKIFKIHFSSDRQVYQKLISVSSQR